MITVAGLTPSVDLTYVVDHLELGRIHRPTEVVRRAGGKPLNSGAGRRGSGRGRLDRRGAGRLDRGLAGRRAGPGRDHGAPGDHAGAHPDLRVDQRGGLRRAHRAVRVRRADPGRRVDPRPGGADRRAGRPPGLAGDLRRTATRPAADRSRRAGRAGPPRRLSGGRRHPRRLAGALAAQPAGAGEDQPVRGGSGAGGRCRHSTGADGRAGAGEERRHRWCSPTAPPGRWVWAPTVGRTR